MDDNNPVGPSHVTLIIGKDTRITVDDGALPAGHYQADGFAWIEAGDGTLAVLVAVPAHNPARKVIGSLHTGGNLEFQVQ